MKIVKVDRRNGIPKKGNGIEPVTTERRHMSSKITGVPQPKTATERKNGATSIKDVGKPLTEEPTDYRRDYYHSCWS